MPGGYPLSSAAKPCRTSNGPVVSLAAAVGLLVAAAVPYFDIHTGFAGVSTLPDSLPSKQAFVFLDREFSGGLVSPAEIVIDGPIGAEPVQAGIGRLESALAADGAFGRPSLTVNPPGDLALLSVSVQGDPNSEETIGAVRRLRGQHIPQAFAGVEADVLVGGDTALNIDFFDMAGRYLPVVFAFVLGLSFVLLTVVF